VQTTEQNQLPTGLQLGLVRTVATSRNFLQGSRQASTGTWTWPSTATASSVTMPDGTIAYTRDGSFEVLNGQLVTSSGLSVGTASPSRTAPPRCRSAQGEVSAVVPPATPHRWAPFATAFHQSGRPGASRAETFIETVASGQPQRHARHQRPGHASAGLSGSLERHVVQELVTMIQTQRAYEMNSKAIQTSDQMLAKLSQL
jgi:flagellar basal-body rod protein FlgG